MDRDIAMIGTDSSRGLPSPAENDYPPRFKEFPRARWWCHGGWRIQGRVADGRRPVDGIGGRHSLAQSAHHEREASRAGMKPHYAEAA